MQRLPLTRAGQFYPLIDFMEGQGTAIPRMLERFSLPTRMLEDPELYVDESRFWRMFEQEFGRSGGVAPAGDVARSLDLETLGDFGSALLRQTTLHAAITEFCRLAASETLVSTFAIERRGDDFWFRRHDALGGCPISTSQEIYAVHLMMQVVKSSLGVEWRPERVDLQASAPPPFPEMLANAEVRVEQACTGFPIPGAFLPRRMAAPSVSEEITEAYSSIRDVGLAEFPIQLRLLLKGFLPDGLVIDDAAALVGVSARTLQRILTRSGTSFRTVLEQARFEQGREMLKDTATPVSEIARSLGYDSPASFSRAFQRWAGVSPRQFRNTREPAPCLRQERPSGLIVRPTIEI